MLGRERESAKIHGLDQEARKKPAGTSKKRKTGATPRRLDDVAKREGEG
jgi:hypothetical protein